MKKPKVKKSHKSHGAPSFTAPPKREWTRVIELVQKRLPAFVESAEYKRMDQHDTALTTVVIGHFTNYFLKLQRAAMLFPESAVKQKELQLCYDFIEELSASADPEVTNMVATEIFHALPKGEPIREEVVGRLQRKSRELYDASTRF